MARFELTDSFFEDEVREGFYISSAVKKAWGAQLQVLNDVDEVCSRLGIKYFATWGTFLGTLRHRGYIPWDDDLDICMLRDDYNRFITEGVPMLPEGYQVYNHRNRKDHTKFVANVVARSRICFEPEHLEKYHGFPYIASIDLFQLDYMSNDPNEHELMRSKSKLVLKVSDEIMEDRLTNDELGDRLKLLKEKTGITVPENMSPEDIRQFLDISVEELFAYYLKDRDKADRIVQMMPCGIWDTDFYILPSRFYSTTVELPFETGTMPVPLYYEPAMNHHYAGYMEMYKGGGAHSYPFFESMREDLKEVLDFDLPEYRVDREELFARAKSSGSGAEETSDTYRAVVSECLKEMERLNGLLNEENDPAGISGLCADLQQLAIDLGTYMETVKGEGYDIVSLIEKYCEALYELNMAGNRAAAEEKLECINGILKEIVTETSERKEVLFLPFKGEYWQEFEDEYRRVSERPDTDVYVVPIPYYYKDYLGRMHDMQYDVNAYPADVKITHYDEYDIKLRHPDVIYIQNPYDGWNEVTSIPPFFFSDNLRKHTDMLVYIPWFCTYDFTKDDFKEYAAMKYYCNMPGVVNADRVILHSEAEKEAYISRLCDFAGDDTREIWEEKLTVASHTDLKDDTEDHGAGNDKKTKTLLYYPDFSEILYYGDKAVDKLKDVIGLVRAAGGSWKCIILLGELIEEKLKELEPDLSERYMALISEASSDDLFEILYDKDTDIKALAGRCDAYYGDGGHMAHLVRNACKPVKIQSYTESDLDDIDRIYENADFACLRQGLML